MLPVCCFATLDISSSGVPVASSVLSEFSEQRPLSRSDFWLICLFGHEALLSFDDAIL